MEIVSYFIGFLVYAPLHLSFILPIVTFLWILYRLRTNYSEKMISIPKFVLRSLITGNVVLIVLLTLLGISSAGVGIMLLVFDLGDILIQYLMAMLVIFVLSLMLYPVTRNIVFKNPPTEYDSDSRKSHSIYLYVLIAIVIIALLLYSGLHSIGLI